MNQIYYNIIKRKIDLFLRTFITESETIFIQDDALIHPGEYGMYRERCLKELLKNIGSFANVGVVKSICKQVQTAAYQGSNHGISATGGFTSHGYSCRNRVSFVN